MTSSKTNTDEKSESKNIEGSRSNNIANNNNRDGDIECFSSYNVSVSKGIYNNGGEVTSSTAKGSTSSKDQETLSKTV